MELDYSAIGNRVRNARKEMGLSQESLAEMVGLSTSHVCHIECGTTKPSLDAMVRIANALHVTVERLLSDNIEVPYDSFSMDILAELEDCSEQQKTGFLEVVRSVKKLVREKG